MSLRVFVGFSVAAAILASQAGCRCFHRDSDHPYARPYDNPRPYNPTAPLIPAPRPGSPEVLQPEPFAPSGAPALPVPGGATSRFDASGSQPGPPVPTPRDLLPPANVPVDSRYYSPPRVIDRSEPPLAPLNPFGKSDKPSDPMPSDPRLLPPGLLDPQTSAKNPLPGDPAASPAFPVIDSFSGVMDQVSTGFKPADTEGLDWLQTNKYKTIIHLRRPGSPHTADKEQIEKRGMKYLTFEVSAESLTPSLVAEFSRAVGSRSDRPLFVYDKDGTLVGAMWYVYFRTVDKLSDADAKKRAIDFGLKAAETGDHSALWKAAQKVAQE